MSIFRYDSRHKIIVGAGIVIAIALHTLLRDREQPKYDNGQMKQQGNVVMGRNHGTWTWFHPNGKRKMQGRFERGKRTGLWVTFSPTGDTLTTSMYERDRLNGEHRVFGSDGRPQKVIIYKDDASLSVRQIAD